MSLNDFFYNGKSKTGAALVFSAGEVGFVKSFPDFFQTVFGNTDSGILDRDKYFVVLLSCLNRDRGILMTELDRIVDQIVKYLLDFAEISSDKQQPIVYMVVNACHGFLFGTLYAPAQAILFGLSFKGMIAWIIAGLPWDFVHGVSNFFCGILIVPIVTLLRKLEKQVG